MLRVLRNFVIGGLVSLSPLLWQNPESQAGDPTWGHFQANRQSATSNQTTPAYYYINAAPTSVVSSAPSMPAPSTVAVNSNSVTYRSYAPDPASSPNSYYYVPGPCGCYSYVPGPSPAVASPPPAAVTANSANSGAYRSFSADPVSSPVYTYYPGGYTSHPVGSGHSWGGRR
jgi:hypothetical protein